MKAGFYLLEPAFFYLHTPVPPLKEWKQPTVDSIIKQTRLYLLLTPSLA